MIVQCTVAYTHGQVAVRNPGQLPRLWPGCVFKRAFISISKFLLEASGTAGDISSFGYSNTIFYMDASNITDRPAGLYTLQRGHIASRHRRLARYVKLRVAHAPGMPGTFSLPPRVVEPDMHHGTCMTHVSWCMPGSLTNGFPWSQWRRKHSRHSQRMRNAQFYASGRRSIDQAAPQFIHCGLVTILGLINRG